MSEINTLLWQTEIFLSMSTKVADPFLAAALQHAAENYLIRATEVAQQQQAGRKIKGLAYPRNAA
jgi:hypothetical protein